MERTNLKKNYWTKAVGNCADIRMLAIAGVMTALSIAVKAFNINIIPNTLIISFACYFHALGAFIYGPVLALFTGAISDTLGAVIFPAGPYFLPYIIPEMLSCFIYALFLWNREKITVLRVLSARFTVNIICNIILNSVITKWYMIYFNINNAFSIVNSLRIAKNLVLFPLEGVLMAIIIMAAITPLKRLGVINAQTNGEPLNGKSIVTVSLLFLISVGLVVGFYYSYPFLKAHQFVFL
ncbi:MAG TPA: hypothetical protein DEW35_03280 [Ruminococcaceae bacterium]|nr:hypothetical protein [Oscillospiraceae bacterium]